MNRTLQLVVATMGVVLAISGMAHGFFETLQGSTPTGSIFIEAIDETHRTWEHGSEGALTLIPNFLITGIVAIGVSLLIVVWSLGFLQTKHGATVFLLLFVALLFTGGGIGQVAFFIPAWAFATRINKPLTWWSRVLPRGIRGGLSHVWPWTTAVGVLLFLLALTISIVGYFPGINDADQLLSFIFLLLGIGLGCYLVSFVSAIAHDIMLKESAHQVSGSDHAVKAAT